MGPRDGEAARCTETRRAFEEGDVKDDQSLDYLDGIDQEVLDALENGDDEPDDIPAEYRADEDAGEAMHYVYVYRAFFLGGPGTRFYGHLVRPSDRFCGNVPVSWAWRTRTLWGQCRSGAYFWKLGYY